MNLFDDPRIDSRIADLLGPQLVGVIESAFKSMEIAEEEIARARGTDKVDSDDQTWQAFGLLRPTHALMSTEFVYRSHCREILARVRSGFDTRPATDAEIAVNLSEASLSAPVPALAAGLQTRLFKRSFPEQYEQLAIEAEPYERMYGGQLDAWERDLRAKLRQDWRAP